MAPLYLQGPTGGEYVPRDDALFKDRAAPDSGVRSQGRDRIRQPHRITGFRPL
jgi:hypothetical protein